MEPPYGCLGSSPGQGVNFSHAKSRWALPAVAETTVWLGVWPCLLSLAQCQLFLN